MKNWALYRLGLQFVPVDKKAAGDVPEAVRKIFEKNRVKSAGLAVFDRQSVEVFAYGGAAHGTVYRAASISKLITALGVMRLLEERKISLDSDVDAFLPVSLRHPKSPQMPITLRMLLCHTGGIHDGVTYNNKVGSGAPLSEILQGDSHTVHLPNTLFEYSNLGAGIIGSVLEGATGVCFETLMQQTVFVPLGVVASFYPQNMGDDLANAYRILPPSKGAAMDARKRAAAPLPPLQPDPMQHYGLAHGNLYISAGNLARLGQALMNPGFLSDASLKAMRTPAVPFGERADNLWQGLGTFILKEPGISPHTLYGHQGMAYGAVHGLFYDPERQRGAALLTSAANEARRGVLADLNFDILKHYLGERA